MRHPAFPRGPPPQYYPGSTVLLNIADRTDGWEAVTHAVIWPHMKNKNKIFFFLKSLSS